MTPSQKRRAKRRKCLQRKQAPEMRLVRSSGRVIGERLVNSNTNETLDDARKMGVR
jgi:hypothetical protein